MFNLCLYYEKQQDYDNMIKYYHNGYNKKKITQTQYLNYKIIINEQDHDGIIKYQFYHYKFVYFFYYPNYNC